MATALRLLACAWFVTTPVPVFAQETPADKPAERPPNAAGRPRVGLALGGGGARGMAHIGVIRALEQLHVPIDYVVGTSMGSIVGGLYACGYTPDEMEKLIKSIHWDTLFQDAPERAQQSFRQKEDDFEHLIPFEFGLNFKKGGLVLPPGLIAGSKLGYVLESAMLGCSSVPDFDHLRIPFRAVATDIQTGEPFIMSKGNLARTIRASMAIPAIFTPVEIDGRLLIDGGESQNLPVQTVRAMGADIVIAVNVGSSGGASAEKPTNVGAMIGRLIDLPLQQNTQASAKLADLVITPDLGKYTSADFVTGTEMIPLGYKSAMAEKAKLEAWSDPESVYSTWKLRHDLTRPPLPVIDAIEIDPVPGMDPRRVSSLVKTKTGQILDTKVLGQDLKRIYAIGSFEIVSYQIVEEGSRHILRITATPKSWGPTYLKLGLFLATDFQLATNFGIVGLIEATELNRLGGMWKTTVTIGSPLEVKTRFYQPLSYGGHTFLSPHAEFNQNLVRVYDDDGNALLTYQTTRGGGGLDLGYDFGTWGEFRLGYFRSYGKAHRKVGDPNFPDASWDEGGISSSFVVDQIDNVNLPHEGYLAVASYNGYRKSLGSTDNYDNLTMGLVGVHTIDRWTGLVKAEGGTSLQSDSPFYGKYSLGGLFRLSGRPQDQLVGDNYAQVSLLLYYRLTATGGIIIKNLSVGVSAEAGNAYARREPVTFSSLKTAGSVFLVADTVIGPLFLAYGHSGAHNNAAYLVLNRSF
ncbi:MAG TPA: patatin-like phospholipase family protein [Thermoanaerobaculia bacterium]